MCKYADVQMLTAERYARCKIQLGKVCAVGSSYLAVTDYNPQPNQLK
jgi:hypothetical protein